MTEKQIEQLKKVLANSSLENKLDDQSKDLDNKILRAAQRQAKSSQQRSSRSWLSNLDLPFNYMGAVSLAVLFTMGLFFGMSQIVSPPEQNLVSATVDEVKRPEFVSINSNEKAVIARPEYLAQEEAPTNISRDKILVDFALPSTDELIAKMEFGVDHERANARANIDLALNDISIMISLGTFDGARERYAKLLENCVSCILPPTLEALVLSSINGQEHSSSDTS